MILSSLASRSEGAQRSDEVGGRVCAHPAGGGALQVPSADVLVGAS